ncbi:hypothetical protein H2198_000155 [Neophaeococcomyces mojaviensis]|uniref:Uncharacterized protein n=1 Tax=Neophaeococcomyces mojaviensis TaxID=3383035 RepID=A0ACC3AKD2_9EURO|nr:hypothetical protein H2198_000155 [Knufia sp. JES_112]
MSTKTDLPSQVDVVVVGAGPTGLVTACLLRKSGIAAIILDSAPAPATTSRASVIHLRTLEMLEKLGLTDSIVEQGLPIREMTLYEKDTLLSGLEFSGLHARYDHAVALPQTETETTLTSKLHELGGEIYRDYTVAEVLRNDQINVRISVKHNTNHTTETITAKYVVAADGLHSTIRQSLDIPFVGAQYALSFATADVHMDPLVWPHQHLRDRVNLYLDPAGFLLVVPFPSPENNLWRVIATVESAPKTPDRAFLDDLVRSRGPKVGSARVVTDVVWGSHFRINHRLATQYRKGRIFLAGDAAHTHSPVGGQGMNTGMQDAEYLATVLADAVLSGRDSEMDLDRYEKVWRPVAQGVVALTHRLTVATTVANPWVCWARNRMMWLVPKIVPGLKRYMSWRGQ